MKNKIFNMTGDQKDRIIRDNIKAGRSKYCGISYDTPPKWMSQQMIEMLWSKEELEELKKDK